LRDEKKVDPHSLNIKSLVVHLGVDDREALQNLWNAPVYDTYGTNECGSLAAECEYQTGMHVFEDAFVLEIVDQETQKPRAPGERGVIYQTTLFKHLAPMIRFNSNDVSAWAAGECPCGCRHPRLERIYGRSDNMVKLRGTNVFPEAVGELASADPRLNGEYLCIVEAKNGTDAMTVMVEALGDNDTPAVAQDFAGRLKDALGVKVEVKITKSGELDEMTGLSTTSKVRRLIDKRK